MVIYILVIINLNFSKLNVPAELWEPINGLPLLLWVSLTSFIVIIYFLKVNITNHYHCKGEKKTEVQFLSLVLFALQ